MTPLISQDAMTLLWLAILIVIVLAGAVLLGRQLWQTHTVIDLEAKVRRAWRARIARRPDAAQRWGIVAPEEPSYTVHAHVTTVSAEQLADALERNRPYVKAAAAHWLKERKERGLPTDRFDTQEPTP